MIASLQPDGETSYSYSSYYTFLSTKNFVNRSSDTLTTESWLLVSNASTGQIRNGGFETRAYKPGDSMVDLCASPDYFSLCGWEVKSAPIDYLNTGIVPSANGSYSVHLNSDVVTGYSAASISQTFRTESGKYYTLSFYSTAFPPNVTVPGSRPSFDRLH